MIRGHNRHLFRVERKVETKTDSGAVTTSWILFCTLWASIEVMRAYEKQSSEASWPGADCRIKGNYVEGLLPTMRLVLDNKIYSILGINDLKGRHREVEFICQTGLKSS